MKKLNPEVLFVPQHCAPECIGFFLLEDFTLISLASAVAPLRMANQLSGKELYRWFTLSKDGEPVCASDGLVITPDASIDAAPVLDTVIVCGGVDIQHRVSGKHIKWLQSQARQGRQLGAVCSGSWVLAQAGLLDGCLYSVHWECLPAMQEAFPLADACNHLFSIDRNRYTSSGGTAPMDMMLHLIVRDHGRELAADISEMFSYDRVRNEQHQQRVPFRHTLCTNHPKLKNIVMLMEANLEAIINLEELAGRVALSRRQLERLFERYLGCTPSRYYLKLRLTRARQLLKQTSISILEVASICGFVSTAHFSRCYRRHFGTSPCYQRTRQNSTMALKSVPECLVENALSPAHAALSRAQGEPSFASVKV